MLSHRKGIFRPETIHIYRECFDTENAERNRRGDLFPELPERALEERYRPAALCAPL
jgi:hypothetical protein